MKNLMRAARLHKYNTPLKIDEIPIPEIGPTDVLVDVKACGIDAGTDINIIKGIHPRPRDLPFVAGHEATGIVAEVGSKVETLHEKDRVLLYPFLSCGNCYNCSIGMDNYCSVSTALIGIDQGTSGGFAEYMKAPERNLYKLPETIPYDQGTMVCGGLAMAHQGVEAASVKPGDSVAVYGTGAVGMQVIQLAKIYGATKIIAVDLVEEKLRLAKEVGADETINPTEEDPVEKTRELTNGKGVDVALEAAGVQETIEQSILSLASGGRAAMMGYNPKYPLHIEIDLKKYLNLLGHTVVGIWAYRRKDFWKVLRLLEARKINLSWSVADCVSLDEINKGIELTEAGRALRVVVKQY